MPDFSHLKKYAVTEETTAEFTFDRIEGDPSVILAPAHECNTAYHRERLAQTLKLAEAMPTKGNLKQTPADIIKITDEGRETDRKLLAFYCARGWGTAPVDSKGKEVEFTPENCYEFFAAIPPEMFDPVRNFAANLFNFFPERNAPLGEKDGEALGNS